MNMNERESNSNFVIVRKVFWYATEQYQKGFTDLHLLILIYMQRYKAINSNEMTFCIGWLYDDLNITNDKAKQDIIASLFDLLEMELIELNDLDIDSVNRNTRIVANLLDVEEGFVMIDNDAIDKILSLDLDIRQKRTMLFIYTIIASRIDDKGYCYQIGRASCRERV